MTRFTERHLLALFLLVTFALSWPLWIASGVLSRTGAYPADPAWLLAQVGVFAPAFAALLVGSLSRPEIRGRATGILLGLYLPAVLLGAAVASRGFSDLRRVEAPWTVLAGLLAVAVVAVLGRAANRVEPWPLVEARPATVARWTLGALLVPVVVLVAGFALSNPAEGVRATLVAVPVRAFTAVAVVEALGWGLVYGGSLGEEPGWRGLLLPRLLRDRTPFGASLVVGFWWALWHAPVDFVQGFGVPGIGGILVRQIWTLPIAVLFTWVTVRAGGNLLPAIAFHTALDTVPDFALSEPARYEASVATFLVVGLVAAVAVVVLDPRMLRSPAPDTSGGGIGSGASGSGPGHAGE
jgi:membrane protease YdiL (CAAX protease family)